MTPISKKITIKSLLLIAIVTFSSIVSLASLSEAMHGIKDSKNRLKGLVKEADKYKRDSIDYFEKQINAIDEQDPELEKKAANVGNLRAEFQRLERDTAKNNDKKRKLYQEIMAAKDNQDLEDAVDEFIVDLFKKQCNPSAIASLDKFDPFLNDEYFKTFKKDREVLRKFQEYADGIEAPLDSVYRLLSREDWAKQEEGSEILKIFDKAWKKVEYRKHFEKKNEKILFLDSIVTRITDMRTLGFEDMEDEFKDIRKLLKPADQPIATPLDELIAKKELYDKLSADIEKDENRMSELNRDIDLIDNLVNKTAMDDAEFARLDKLIADNTRHWYAMRKVIDGEILDWCAKCLSEPADSAGDNYRMRESVEAELMDFAQSDASKKKVETYKVLFNNYYDYTMDIRQFLKDYAGLRAAGGRPIPADKKNKAINALHNLKYWQYYSHRKDKDAVSSPHLDRILERYETMLNSNFSGVTKEAYNKLGHDLMGTKKPAAASPKANDEVDPLDEIDLNRDGDNNQEINNVTTPVDPAADPQQGTELED